MFKDNPFIKARKMNEENNDGGPAFPQVGETSGMSLRAYYAGEALKGMLAHQRRYKPRKDAPTNWHDAISQESIEIADAMILALSGHKAQKIVDLKTEVQALKKKIEAQEKTIGILVGTASELSKQE